MKQGMNRADDSVDEQVRSSNPKNKSRTTIYPPVDECDIACRV